jgi:hypothetical protein
MSYLKYHVSGNKRLKSLNLYVVIVISGETQQNIKETFCVSCVL